MKEAQLREWQTILLRFGVDDFATNDLLCILHFKGTDIELERTEYKVGGEALQVILKRSALRHNGVPTIFPSKIPRNEKRRKLNYAQKLDYETIAKQKKIFEDAQKLEYETINKQKKISEATKEKPMKRALKRKVSSDFMTDEDSVVNAKLMKTNNLFQELLSAVGNNKKLYPLFWVVPG